LKIVRIFNNVIFVTVIHKKNNDFYYLKFKIRRGMHTKQLSEKWIKASILGTIWASSEIVLGSFLHNLRIPFSGNILTAIGLVILISASYKWKENGLFWRAGVICALLKTMSPSAVIFGPMVAIFSEAFLLELSVRALGKTIFGFVLGAVLAMSWNLFQRIFNFIVFYGYNIVEVYTNLMEYAQRQLHLQFDAVWAPLFLLLVLYALFGAFSAFIGIKTGRKLSTMQTELNRENLHEQPLLFQKKQVSHFKYSMFWLALNVIFMVVPLLLAGKINSGLWVVSIVVVATLWAFRYKRALRQLMRPKFWIFFALITMLAAFVFTRLQSEKITITDAIFIGVEMNLRAILLIMGFTVLGTELYNPKIRNSLAKSYFKQLPPALELSLESLPFMISLVPDLKSIVKNPVQVIAKMMAHAEGRIEKINENPQHKIFIITGEIGTGKTSFFEKAIKNAVAKQKTVAGILTRRHMDGEITTGYNVVDVSTGMVFPFLRTEGNKNQQKIGKYFIDESGLNFGRQVLQNIENDNVIFIDEIGRLELAGGGWANELEPLFQKNSRFILSVREETVEQVIQKWKLKSYEIFDLNEMNKDRVLEKILNF